MQTGRRVPFDDDLFSYFATRARRRGARRRGAAAWRKAPSPSPGDWIATDVIEYGGRVVRRVLALLFSVILATDITPPDWRVDVRRDLHKNAAISITINRLEGLLRRNQLRATRGRVESYRMEL